MAQWILGSDLTGFNTIRTNSMGVYTTSK